MSGRYKYCIVPKCTSTSVSTPDKAFLNLPKNSADRKRWCQAMKRDEQKNPPFSENSTRHVCEDHFDLESDIENYMRYKLQGGRLYLKAGVVPHIFECQGIKKAAASTERAAKRQRVIMVNDLLHNADQPHSSTSPVPIQRVPVLQETSDDKVPSCDKAIQALIRHPYRSRGTNTVQIETVEVGCSIAPNMSNASCATFSKHSSDICHTTSDEQIVFSDTDDTLDESSEYEFVDDSSDSDFEPEPDDSQLCQQMRECMVVAVRKQSMMCLGIPEHITFLIEYLSKTSEILPLHILITLKKIHMNNTYAYLAMIFGMSTSNVARIFQKTVPRLASALRNFIIWPSKDVIKRCLPIAFRPRYVGTQSIIDCFEIKIEKPSNPRHQSLTWSEYKKANTVKYLISCTPDGTVNFVSRGYGGRVSDTIVFEDSGYMERLIPNLDVMADRGFKNVSNLLLQKNCKLIRPPSVSADQPMTAEEVMESKRISALRIHVERVIGRIKFFDMCAPNACVDHNHLQIFDEVIMIVCGLINLQTILIRS